MNNSSSNSDSEQDSNSEHEISVEEDEPVDEVTPPPLYDTEEDEKSVDSEDQDQIEGYGITEMISLPGMLEEDEEEFEYNMARVLGNIQDDEFDIANEMEDAREELEQGRVIGDDEEDIPTTKTKAEEKYEKLYTRLEEEPFYPGSTHSSLEAFLLIERLMIKGNVSKTFCGLLLTVLCFLLPEGTTLPKYLQGFLKVRWCI